MNIGKFVYPVAFKVNSKDAFFVRAKAMGRYLSFK
ncbi:MAG: hypothetical protein ACI9DK_002947 [Vicingaceae bacterium]|jgi:hypothetical protein